MHNQYSNKLFLDLHLFDGAAGGAAGAAGGAAAGGEGASAKAETTSGTGSSRQSKKGEPTVVYGKQSEASEAASTTTPAAEGSAPAESKTPEDKAAAFREMIRGEFKDQFTAEAQGIINRRFKESKGMEATIAAQKPIMDLLAQMHGIEDGDPAKILSALEQNNHYWEEAAEKAGMTVEQYKGWQKLQQENAAFKKMQERAQNQQKAQQQLAVWMQDAEALKKDFYPGFDLNTELANPMFLDFLKRQIPMKQAYELIHMEEIKTAEAKKAAETASAQMQANIKAKAARPAENGTSKQSAVITKSDVHSLTREDRAAAAREAMRGKKIQW